MLLQCPKVLLVLCTLLTHTLAAATPVHDGLYRRDDVSPLTTFIDYFDCSDEYKNIINEASRDALELANASLEDDKELSTQEHYHKTIDFNSRPARDFFGDNVLNAGQQGKIMTALYRSSITKTVWGWDWWQDKYISYSCKDFAGPATGCTGDAPAYLDNSGAHSKYPIVVFCDSFFKKLESHSQRKEAVKADASGQKKLNLRNMRGRATTVLHEWQHIESIYKARTCEGGCVDTFQELGPIGNRKRVRTYKPGRAKLLAQKDVVAAATTNDNYAYFATARWMEKNFGVYPEYPHAWDDRKTRQENEDNESKEPGAPQTLQVWELEDDEFKVDDGRTGVKGPPLNLPRMDIPQSGQGYLTPASDKIKCETTDNSPNLGDCLQAFTQLNMAPEISPLKGKSGAQWWAAYYRSCAIGIQYDGNWNNDCAAKMGDIRAHALGITQMCGSGKNDKVGGQVPFAVPNCPARIVVYKAGGSKLSGAP